VTELTYTVQNALQEADWGVAVERVRNAIIAEMKRLDPRVAIRYTDYFNHSYIPDFILAWPEEGERERQLYLRHEVAHKSFVEDIKWLYEGGPMFLGLRPQQDEGDFEYQLSDGDPQERCLVTLTDALDEWTPDGAVAADQAFATGALVQAGKGLVNQSAAATVGAALAEGLPALFSGREAEKVNLALDALQPYLPSEFEERLERRFWYFWLGAGGHASAFQRRGFGLGSFERDELRDLLRFLCGRELIADPDYWHQLGMHLSAHALGELLERQPAADNLDALVRTNLAGWTARGAGAQAYPAVPFEPGFAWRVDQNMLGLDIGDLALFFTDDRRHFNNWPAVGPQPRWSDLRLKLADHNIIQVEVLTPENEVVVRRREGQTIRSESEDLKRFAAGSAHDAVRAVTVQAPGTAVEARIDFARRVIDAGDDNVPLRTMALLAARYLSGISEARLHELERFLDRPVTADQPAQQAG
jgi:hypothetical protein